MSNEKKLPVLGVALVYNFLLVVTILPKYVSGCWARVMMSCTNRPSTLLIENSEKNNQIKVYISHQIVNQLSTVLLGVFWTLMLDSTANVSLQPHTSWRGGHCLLHTEITLPYQLSVEMKCFMFVCCRRAMAVNQAQSESCTNLFFTALLLERTNDGGFGRKQARDPCCNAVFLSVYTDQIREETAALGLPESKYNKIWLHHPCTFSFTGRALSTGSERA